MAVVVYHRFTFYLFTFHLPCNVPTFTYIQSYNQLTKQQTNKQTDPIACDPSYIPHPFIDIAYITSYYIESSSVALQGSIYLQPRRTYPLTVHTKYRVSPAGLRKSPQVSASPRFIPLRLQVFAKFRQTSPDFAKLHFASLNFTSRTASPRRTTTTHPPTDPSPRHHHHHPHIAVAAHNPVVPPSPPWKA